MTPTLVQFVITFVSAVTATYTFKEIANRVLIDRINSWLRPEPLTMSDVIGIWASAFLIAFFVGLGLRIGFKGFAKRD